MGIRQMNMTNSDLPGSDNMDQTDVQWAGRLAGQIR